MTAETTSRGKVLVTGASIAGPTVAYWLNRYGFDVTVVEKAPTIRTGGYPIDVRGPALEVVRRMGLLPRIREAEVDTNRAVFLNADGSELVTTHPHQVVGSITGHDVELPRGELTKALYDAARDGVRFVFGDHIEALEQHDDGVDVTFHGGGSRRFDVVVSGEGIHSHTRELVFGPEQQFHRFLGYCFAVFTMPNDYGIDREVVMWTDVGRAAAIYPSGNEGEVFGFFTFAVPEVPYYAFHDVEAQRKMVRETYAGAGWEVPRLVAAMQEADDIFFDTVSQIRMPRWTSGRVALVGDAAHAPSFLTGQGTSLSLISSYMLARSLRDNPDVASAFAAYERDTREFAALNQGLIDESAAALFPTTPEELREHNERLSRLTTMPGSEGRPEYSAITLPPEPGE